jgi:SAM-dependent methyltransferase
MQMDEAAARIERERRFHDARFAGGEDDRTAQDKYYLALKGCFDRYEGRRHELARNAVVLEYGCAHGHNAIALASTAQHIEGIDISREAVNAGNSDVASRGISNVRLSVQNAEAMDFADGTFDLVYGSGILHHLDFNTAMSELRRVLKPGGVALFAEPLGHNPLIEVYRRRTPDARTADEHPLLSSDFKAFDGTFHQSEHRFYGLASLAVVPVRNMPAAAAALRTIGALVDAVLLRIPGLKWWAWYAVMEGRRA